MLRTLVAAAALGLIAASPAYAITGSGTITFDFTHFSGPFGLSDAANLGNPAGWAQLGSVNGQIPTVNGVTTPASCCGFLYVGGDQAISGNSVDMVYTTLPGALNNNITFTPGPNFTNLADHTPFLLGTLSFTNGQWVGGSGNPATNYPTVLDFTLQTHSLDQPAFNQTLTDSITFVTNQAANDIDCATNPQTQQDEADFIYITGVPALGSGRVYDAFCAPPGVPNSGSVQLWAEFGSLDLIGFRNPTGGLFLADSVSPGPVGGGVPEPAAWALMLGGFGLLGGALRRARSGRAVPVHA
jgi:hypothetical protein